MDQIDILSNVGNGMANEFYEAEIPRGYKKITCDSTMEECWKFVNDKYVKKLFAPKDKRTPAEIAKSFKERKLHHSNTQIIR